MFSILCRKIGKLCTRLGLLLCLCKRGGRGRGGITFTLASYGGEKEVETVKPKLIRLASFNTGYFLRASAVPYCSQMECFQMMSSPSTSHGGEREERINHRRFHRKSNLCSSEGLTRHSEEFLAVVQHKNSLAAVTFFPPRPSSRVTRSILDVLLEADADIVALQEVIADEAKGMRPLSELAKALGMHYAFAESWAPQFGNAILSRWPIKSSEIKKLLVDNSDYRSVLNVVVDVPSAADLHFCCTHLDHLDEDLRLKQITSLVDSVMDFPHILAGDLNALERSDYSDDRWMDIAKLQESRGKMHPRAETMNFLKEKGYRDSKFFAGDSELVVLCPKGQDVEGTCKIGTRVDYILASPNFPYKFMPGSYGIVSSKGTSDHHLVKVDIQS